MSEHTPKVWVVNFAGHDYSPAKQYGELDFLTRGYVSLGSLDRLFYTISEAVAETHPDDFILPAGFAILNVVASAVWLQLHGKINILVWDPKQERYRQLTFTGDQINDLVNVLDQDASEA